MARFKRSFRPFRRFRRSYRTFRRNRPIRFYTPKSKNQKSLLLVALVGGLFFLFKDKIFSLLGKTA